MTLLSLLTKIGIASLVFTGIVAFLLKKKENWLMTLLQSFCGLLFLFSGWVKAVDPLGTAYKMEQYFGEFQSTFEGTWFSFIAPIFPFFSSIAIWFSVFMIVFEIVLGIMLLIGAKPKITSWAFFLLVVFFTILTGFTYLTGHVPNDVNFFQFGSWGPYVESNMKVTDCGCFGDFIKLEPKTSFFKDVFLLFPSVYFLLRHKDMHQLFTQKSRLLVTVLSTLLIFVYCLMNFSWNIPHVDFRPFYKGADIRTQKQLEMDAMANVQITAWKLKNKNTSEVLELSNAVYMKEYSKYPKTDWTVIEQIKSEPSVKQTKVSDFEMSDMKGNEITEEILNNKDAFFMVVSHKVYARTELVKRTVQDSVFIVDTIMMFENDEEKEMIVEKFDRMESKEVTEEKYHWDDDFIAPYETKIKGLIADARQAGLKTIIVTGGADADLMADFETRLELGAEYATSDDILLKTLVRSNPGVMLWKDGKVLNKWHINKLPSFENIAMKNLGL